MMMRRLMWLLAAALVPSAVSAQEAPLQIFAPPSVTVSADNGRCSAFVNFGTPATSGGGSHRVDGARSDGQAMSAAFPKGGTTITWTLTGDQGQTANATQTITVNDTEPPQIAAQDITMDTLAGSCFGRLDRTPATASDNCGEVRLTPARSDGDRVEADYPNGTTTIQWTAIDGSGLSTTVVQTILVRDVEPPHIDPMDNIEVDAEAGQCTAPVKLAVPAATDNCSKEIQVIGTRSDGQPITDGAMTFPGGITHVTWTATDAAGQISRVVQNIDVRDTQDPTVDAPADRTGVT